MPAIRVKRPVSLTPAEAGSKLCLSRPEISAEYYGNAAALCKSTSCMAWVWDARNPEKGYCLVVLAALGIQEVD